MLIKLTLFVLNLVFIIVLFIKLWPFILIVGSIFYFRFLNAFFLLSWSFVIIPMLVTSLISTIDLLCDLFISHLILFMCRRFSRCGWNRTSFLNFCIFVVNTHFLTSDNSILLLAIVLPQVIQIWFEVQRTWSHLESIFIGSEDIRKQLPEDSARFDRIDTDFKVSMFILYLQQNSTDCDKDVVKGYYLKILLFSLLVKILLFFIKDQHGFKGRLWSCLSQLYFQSVLHLPFNCNRQNSLQKA